MTGTAAPRRLQGHLRPSERGFLLDMDDGPVWRLAGVEDFAPFADKKVIVEARKAGSGLLDILWIGLA